MFSYLNHFYISNPSEEIIGIYYDTDLGRTIVCTKSMGNIKIPSVGNHVVEINEALKKYESKEKMERTNNILFGPTLK